jgi:(4-O-methyl)-D-glucuronate---lignin esterase
MLLVKKNKLLATVFISVTFLLTYGCSRKFFNSSKADYRDLSELRSGFMNPPDSARPGVYWYFMDGNLSAKGMTEDLESMKAAGIGNVVFLEVNVGVPRGTVDYLSDEWLDLFKHTVDECKRLGINMTLGIGPGWTGSGGPWVTPAQSMQHLVASTINISASDNRNKKIILPLPYPRKPYFGMSVFTPSLKEQWTDFYYDVAVLAFPTPSNNRKISDIDEIALYYRAPFSSVRGVKPFIPSLLLNDSVDNDVISKGRIVDISEKLQPDGNLNWKVPPGNWTIMRFVSRNNGAVTRPAPVQGLGFESDKFDTTAINSHLDHYIGKIIQKIGIPLKNEAGGLKFLHMDSWEMGAQNWTEEFREEFTKRSGYDPLPFYPVYGGNIVESREISERFLWDLRQTSQELILENHALQVKKYAHRYGLDLSIEPYDMNPAADFELGAIADVPMGEFWSKGYGYNTSFSIIEAASIAHIQGQPIVQAEAFTSNPGEDWKQYPGSMKNQGDWAFANGINRFFYHTFEHKPLNDNLRPGMTMGPYGVHWDRKQTWWPMVNAYHQYIARCQFMLQQGKSVADILYLTPEGAPQVFLPPPSAMSGNDTIPDRRGYNFDGCSPGQLYNAEVKNHQLIFPGGSTYSLLVLPVVTTMTPALLNKIRILVADGAIIVGIPPRQSPSLVNYPTCDQEVRSLAKEIWGNTKAPALQTVRTYGKGKVIWGGDMALNYPNALYPDYNYTAKILAEIGVTEEFKCPDSVRYAFRKTKNSDIYFVSNCTNDSLTTSCTLRSTSGVPELWDPLTGETRELPQFSKGENDMKIPMHFDPYQSFFIVIVKNEKPGNSQRHNFPFSRVVAKINGPWTISFDTAWGGPEKLVLNELEDWASRSEKGIKYYSGFATYSNSFDAPYLKTIDKNKKIYLDLGKVNVMANIKLNGQDLGVLWTSPWKKDITELLKQEGNQLEIQVANLWPNRLIGDQFFADNGIRNHQWPGWLIKGEKRPGGRYTFTTYNPYKKEDSLLSSGLLGPVTIMLSDF